MQRHVIILCVLSVVWTGCATGSSSENTEQRRLNKREFQKNREQFEAGYRETEQTVESLVADIDRRLGEVPDEAREELTFKQIAKKHESLEERFDEVRSVHRQILEWESRTASEPTQEDIVEQTRRRNECQRRLERIREEYERLDERLSRFENREQDNSE